MFEFKPDYEKAKERIMAWWEREVLDRAPAYIVFPKPESERVPYPEKQFSSIKERWFDAEFNAEKAYADCANNVWYAEALPIKYPNLGPEVFSAFFGCELEYTERTSWSIPILKDWSEESVAKIKFNPDNFYFKKIMELTDAYLELGRGKFIVGYTDIHPGGDAIAAFRDPQMLCMDMIEHPQEVKKMVDWITDEFFKIYDMFYQKLSSAGMPSTTWLPLISDGRYHVPSNDFSCMISPQQFKDIFLEGIIRECNYMTHNIYHLDGPGALRHLDFLLEIDSLQAIQWVPGAGRDYWKDWVDVYKRILSAGKGIVMYVPKDDVDEVMSIFKPEGIFLFIGGVKNDEEAEQILKKLEKWK